MENNMVLETAPLHSSGTTDRRDSHIRTLKRKRYINAINYSNFNGQPLQIIFKHKVFFRILSLEAIPSPCIDENLDLTWCQNIEEELEQFECIKILIPDGENFLSIIPDNYSVSSGGMNLSLPKLADILNGRKTERFSSRGISVSVMQNGCFYEGSLINFNPDTFLISLDEIDNPELRWINRDDYFHLSLMNNSETIYTGGCSLTSSRGSDRDTRHTFRILHSEIRKFKKKEFRGERFELHSPAQISFLHPLSGDRCRIAVTDISASGLCLTEKASHSVLIPGLVIPEMELNLPGGTPLKCRTQVISRRKADDENNKLKCGMAIIDMDPADHALLLNFVHQANDERASVCSSVDSSALWKFFFESGFIYPEKYKHLSAGKEKIKDIYDRLYTQSPNIARHFIYQEENRIQGHMSMLRSYEDSWLMHHHAATAINGSNAGLHVLNQVSSFSNNSYRIRSLHMLYLMCYYREENRFPKRVFGDIAKNADNLEQLSLDSWAYFHINKESEIRTEVEEGWKLEETTREDLKNLESFYQNRSGGLMLKAMNLTNGEFSNKSLLEAYKKSGFNRNLQLFSIKFQGECHGIIMLDQSETGLNMSNLTNSIKVFIINPKGLTRDIIHSFILEVSNLFEGENRIPVLMYPESIPDELGFSKEKSYILWILNTEASDAYFKHLKTLLKKIHS